MSVVEKKGDEPNFENADWETNVCKLLPMLERLMEHHGIRELQFIRPVGQGKVMLVGFRLDADKVN